MSPSSSFVGDAWLLAVLGSCRRRPLGLGFGLALELELELDDVLGLGLGLELEAGAGLEAGASDQPPRARRPATGASLILDCIN
jgi:hypothetical protein